MKLPKFPRTILTVISLLVAFAFGSLEITANELYMLAHPNPFQLYYWPMLGAKTTWDSWSFVFTGLGLCFFFAWMLGYLYGTTKPQLISQRLLLKNPIIDYAPAYRDTKPVQDEPQTPLPSPVPVPAQEVPRATAKKALSLEDL